MPYDGPSPDSRASLAAASDIEDTDGSSSWFGKPGPGRIASLADILTTESLLGERVLGRQIQIRLSDVAERRLADSLGAKFPHCGIVNSVYPTDWDKRSLFRSPGTKRWLIIDHRTEAILIDSATEVASGDWVIRSRAFSCIEWTRDMRVPDNRGRLYLNTDGDPIWLDISAETGDDIEKMFNHARRWLQKNCSREGEGRYPTWVG